MYKLMIVDDEESIREGMARSIPWREWGFEVTALCENGEEAMEKIRQNPPHVVLSDIRMPKMDGVELMSTLNAQYPQIKVVILSGYSDFEYLNMSIKNRVTEYLLKPTDIDEFEEVFERLRTALDKEQQERKQQLHQQELLFITSLDRLLRGNLSTQEGAALAQTAGDYNVWPENSAVLVLSPDEPSNEGQPLPDLQNEIVQICRNCEGAFGKVLFFANSEGNIVGICGTSSEEDLDYQCIFDFVVQLQKAVAQQLGKTISVGISELCTELQMLARAYEQAKCCARQNIFCGKESIFRYSQLEQEIPDKDVYFHTQLLEKALVAQNHEEVAQDIRRVFSVFDKYPLKEYRYIDQLCLSCLLELSRWALQYNVRMEKMLQKAGISYSDIYSCNTLAAKADFMRTVLRALADALEKQRVCNKKSNSVAHQVRQLVDAEFGSNLMSLEYVAGKVNKSTAYISKVFKNELNCNFSDYITRLRMEHAATLLSGTDNPKIYEIAQECGYADVSNFIKVFRKYHNESPNEYRSTILRRGS